MARTVVKNIEELIASLEIERQVGTKLVPQFTDLEIDFNIELPIDDRLIKAKYSYWTREDIIYQNCQFLQTVKFKGSNLNCFFYDCLFNEINADDAVFAGKMRFRKCNFQKMLILDNTSFQDLADFWHSRFHERVVFHKVDFEKTVVFSGSTFEKNVLFTYTWFARLGIFRGTICKKGIDLSLAIIEGTLSIFDFEVTDYDSRHGSFQKMEYESLVHDKGDIPTKNKRETFRIIRNTFEKNSDYINSLYYKNLELKTYDNLLKQKIGLKKEVWSSWFNRFILWLNSKSNNHGTSFISGIIFTTIVALLFFYLSIIATYQYTIELHPCNWSFKSFEECTKLFFISLSPVHKHTYMDSLKPSTWFYIADFAGRIFVSYGIYQTVQAFRKFR